MFFIRSIAVAILLPLAINPAFAVGSAFQVNVIESVNDGSTPNGCGGNAGAGGIAEVSLDLDADGTADLCIGGGGSPANCTGSFNLDCFGVNGGSLCSVEDNIFGSNSLMDGNFSAADNLGDQVGPNFVASTDSVDGSFAGEPMVFGFSGASSNPNVIGYFNMHIDPNDCSYEFGQSFFDDGNNLLAYGDQPTFVVNSIGDAGDDALDGICNTGSLLRGDINECTLRAAIQEANNFPAPVNIVFDFSTGQCDANDLCIINIDSAGTGPLPTISSPITIDGTTHAANATVCDSPISTRAAYKVVLNGNGGNAGLLLDFNSDSSTIRGLNIRGFLDNIRMVGSNNNTVECNFIGTDETGTSASADNAFAGISLLCDSENNMIGGLLPENGNLISGHAEADGIRLFGGLNCAPLGGDIPDNNSILGNYIGTTKDGTTALGNGLDGIALLGGAVSNTFIGVSSDGQTINGNVIGANTNAGIFMDNGVTTTTVMGNYIGTNTTATANLGHGFGGIDMFETNNNIIGGTTADQANVIANNLDGVFATTSNNQNNSIRGNSMFDNVNLAIELVTDGGENSDGLNINDVDDADSGANLLMNYPEILNADFSSLPFPITSINFSVDATEANAAYPLTIDAYFNSEDESMQGRTYLGSVTYNVAQATAIESFTLPNGTTGGQIALTATDANGNTSELSPAVMVGQIDLIFRNGFD
ncbi:hypothetical protein [Marinicella sp. W31]|uniref:hypothetical protein n=1 Tax=Marinicella sp. W31 TaxID=3023713 RepID=UPI003757A9A2